MKVMMMMWRMRSALKNFCPGLEIKLVSFFQSIVEGWDSWVWNRNWRRIIVLICVLQKEKMAKKVRPSHKIYRKT